MITRRLFMLALMSISLFSACNNQNEPSNTPAPIETAANILIVTPDASKRAQELPPTWTATHTPTITLTPTITSTFTVTPSPTPYDLDTLCADFVFSTDIVDGKTYTKGDSLTLNYGISSTYSYAFVGFALSHPDLDKDIASASPGGTSYNAVLDPVEFAKSGRWDYRAGVFLVGQKDIMCKHEGYFVIAEGITRAEQPKIPTALPVPSVTPAGFVEATVEVSAEMTSEVTAEASAEMTAETTVEAPS